MHCNCCDKQLSEKEIIWNPEIDNWELCTTCLDVAMETAYSQGFHIEDDEECYVLDEAFDEDSYVEFNYQQPTFQY